MVEFKIKNKDKPFIGCRLEAEGVANLLSILLTVSVFSTNRAILSLGGLKPNFIKNEKRIFKEPPFLKGH